VHLIAHTFDVWGEQAFTTLEGAFACAIWDQRTRRLWLARDSMGIRPLYFALLHGHGVVFASEIKALFHDPGVTREYAPAAIDAYLTLGYVPAPLTAFRRVSKVEPSQVVMVDGRRLHTTQYWDLPAVDRSMAMPEAAEALEINLRMAVRGAMEPGATVVCSGDAGSAALAWAADGAAAKAFQVPSDETAPFEPMLLATELAARFDEPLADPAAVAQYASLLATQPHGGCALTAHGAAALFGIPGRHTVWDGAQRRAIYTRTFAWEVRDTEPRARYQELARAREDADALERATYVQLRSVLPESILMMADRASVAADVPLTQPYLDRAFVQFAAAIPSRVRTAGPGPLPLLGQLLAGRVPAGAIPADRRHSPTPRWLARTVAATVPELLLAPKFDGRGIVSRPALRTLWDEHRSGRHNHTLRFWSLLMLEFWFREHIDGDAAEAPFEYALLKAA
jgi:asparagine synthase (glutamine-hydrolysing)